MVTVETIVECLKSYARQERGDHTLNPDVAPNPPTRTAAVLILLQQREEGLTILFTQRTDHLSTHAGQVSFPGGGAEKQDRDAVATALREAEEEIGLEASRVRILGQLDDYITRTGYRVTPVVGFLEQEQHWRPDAYEVAKIFEVPVKHLFTSGNLAERVVAREGENHRFYAVQWEEHFIWGATAGMLKNLHEVVGPLPTAGLSRKPPEGFKP